MKEFKPKYDLRTVRTKTLLHNALIQLMKEKPVHNIRVKELIERAQVTRSTFYLHYLDKDDFIVKTIDAVLKEYELRVSAFDQLPYRDSILQRGKVFFGYIAENADFYRAMLGDNGVPLFRSRLQQIGLNYFYSRYLPAVLSEAKHTADVHMTFSILTNYIVSAKIGVVDHWLNSGMKMSPSFLAEITSNFVYTLVKDTITKQEPLNEN